jgi:hypothetical protein
MTDVTVLKSEDIKAVSIFAQSILLWCNKSYGNFGVDFKQQNNIVDVTRSAEIED